MASCEVAKDLTYSTLEIIPRETDLNKQVVYDDGKQKLVNSGEIEPIANRMSDAKEMNDDRIRPRRRWRRREIALISAFASMIILAIVVRGVLGSSRRSNISTTAVVRNRNIAALSFASNSIINTRVYFQNDSEQIIEAANSANNIT